MSETPVLQIIHISDLHFCAGHSDLAKLSREKRMFRLWLRKQLERRNWAGWHEGTLDHDDTAEHAFTEFLQEMREVDGEWFPDEAGKANPPTWLIDTGDGTTFGDRTSMEAVQERLNSWKRVLRGCDVRWLFGNHDAWPSTQPALVGGTDNREISEIQRTQVYDWVHWQPHLWLNPLVATAASGARIECYALNTVSFDWWDNVRAVGRISKDQLQDLYNAISKRADGRSLQILATHHPVAFPYEGKDERKFLFVQQMVLAKSKDVVERLRNEEDENKDLRPLVQLFLSGHTHLGMPGQPLPPTIKEVYQGRLDSLQMQLVTGALMLVRDREAVKAAVGPQTVLKERKDFSEPAVFDANQQFQILRFYEHSDRPKELLLRRFVMVRVPNDPKGYRMVPELSSETWIPIPP